MFPDATFTSPVETSSLKYFVQFLPILKHLNFVFVIYTVH